MCEAADDENRQPLNPLRDSLQMAPRKKKRDRTRLKILLIRLAANLTKVTGGAVRTYGYLPFNKRPFCFGLDSHFGIADIKRF